jgi:type I restriction enzyme R subunit
MKFNEDTRVKIPTILNLVKLGYKYISLKQPDLEIDGNTNIFKNIFIESLLKINESYSREDIVNFFDTVSLSLENEDLGKAFYEKLINQSEIKLIDFENFDKNTFNVVTELTYKKDDDEFRPDITLLLNGLPLVFIEVKKPNNRDGINAEHKRIGTRFKNKKFKKFINLTQLMIFSNNMEYNDYSSDKLEGAFYSTTSYREPIFNYFREEEKFNLNELLIKLDDETENLILKDNNLLSIKNSQEFLVNKNPENPTNRICISLLQRDRISFILKFGINYATKSNKIEKHVMRYPQLFATKAIQNSISKGNKKGIIWHTQGSGKTALAYYNVRHLTEHFKKRKIITKFYFIVDRLDLLTQASLEFRSRGLFVNNINSKEEFANEIKKKVAITNDHGKTEITVVNIQKFQEDKDILEQNDYHLDIQRVYFLDEVHRSYNPRGSFLANLEESDRNAIKIGLTGTPLLGDNNSKTIFGNYIHKYYYNMSIKDGYTLRLIREDIDTKYILKLQKTLEQIQILKGENNKKIVYSHSKFVEPMLDYIIHDFQNSRISLNNNSIGGMVVCDSADQAKKMYEIFVNKYREDLLLKKENYHDKKLKDNFVKSAALILHDVGGKDERKQEVENFKDGKIDLLFVYNMLLTGFDAPRLKKIYLGRVIKAHNLLQALTRVNRTYEDFRYGYVVDFANIESEFEKTNKNYLSELQLELGDDFKTYSNLFKSQKEIEKDIFNIKEILFSYDTKNAEIFSQQISQIDSKDEILKITKVLSDAKDLYNIIRSKGDYELLKKLDFHKFNILAKEAENRLIMINTREALNNKVDSSNLLNMALEDVVFAFTKIKEEEMILADELKNILQKVREILGNNFDQRDPRFISLKEELQRLFEKKNLNEVSKEEMETNIKELNKIYNNAIEIERQNKLLRAKYDNDEKYARLHRRLIEKDPLTESESKLFEILNSLKFQIDSHITQNSNIMENEDYVKKMMMRLVVDEFQNKQKIELTSSTAERINLIISNEYINEYAGRSI